MWCGGRGEEEPCVCEGKKKWEGFITFYCALPSLTLEMYSDHLSSSAWPYHVNDNDDHDNDNNNDNSTNNKHAHFVV